MCNVKSLWVWHSPNIYLAILLEGAGEEEQGEQVKRSRGAGEAGGGGRSNSATSLFKVQNGIPLHKDDLSSSFKHNQVLWKAQYSHSHLHSQYVPLHSTKFTIGTSDKE